MGYIDLRLGDFIENFIMMTTVIVYDTYNDTKIHEQRISGLNTVVTILDNGLDANNYIINYVTSTDSGIEIGVSEE